MAMTHTPYCDANHGPRQACNRALAPPEVPIPPDPPPPVRTTADDPQRAAALAMQIYTSPDEYIADAEGRWLDNGYYPVSIVFMPQRAGFWRIVLISFWALLWQPKPKLLVTYRRES